MSANKKCIHCFQPLSKCRQKDQQLITPFSFLYAAPMQTMSWDVKRYEKTAKYKLGCYNPTIDRIYMYNELTVTERLLADTYLSLPMCVWEDKTALLLLAIFKRDVIAENLINIPLDEEYITILSNLSDSAYDRS
jgi:hypothetical protein